MPCPHKQHTPITSEAQRGLFGAELRRRKRGLTRRMKGITTKELRSHLKEAGGKRLSTRIGQRKDAIRRRARRK